MPTPIDSRGQDNPSTYFVEDRRSNVEMIRLIIQDNLITQAMGGPLSEQADLTSVHRVLDVGCGPGNWMLEAARMYPHMQLVGIDISRRMIEYARAQAHTQRLTAGVKFHVMDVLRPLEFPDNAFDLVNTRLGTSFMSIKDWPSFLQEMLRITRRDGIVRVTDCGIPQTGSPAVEQLFQMMLCAGYKAGYCLTAQSWGVVLILPQLLTESGCHNVQTKAHTLDYAAGTVGAQHFSQDMMYFFQTIRPFIHKWGCATPDYDALYEQAMLELQQHDFHVTWNFLTAWGTKP